jgi:hypothetical protein
MVGMRGESFKHSRYRGRVRGLYGRYRGRAMVGIRGRSTFEDFGSPKK